MKKNIYIAWISKPEENIFKPWLILASSKRGAKMVIAKRKFKPSSHEDIYEANEISFAKPYARIWFKGVENDFDYQHLPRLNEDYYDRERENFVFNCHAWRKAEDALFDNYIKNKKVI